MDFRPTEEQALLRRTVREFAETEMRPHVRDGGTGDLIVVMATPDGAAGPKGISAFIGERGTPGLAAGKKEDKLGRRASDTSEVLFENCGIPADRLLGQEGQGFVNTMQGL